MLKERLKLAMEGPPRVSQADLARACGVKPASVNNWISGKTKTIEGANLLNAARLLNVNPDWLATGRGPRERLRMSEESANYLLGGLGDSVTLVMPPPPSEGVRLDPHILVEAEKWVLFEEGPLERQPDGTVRPRYAYAMLPRAERLSALYAMITADGGTLSPPNAQKLIEAASARLQQGEEGERGKDRASRAATG